MATTDNGDWLKKLLMWNWHDLCVRGYPGWEIAPGTESPAFAKLAHVREGGAVESHDLSIAWDDVAEVGFYQRDWTADSLPFVNKGETYWSGWWFQTIAERDRFLRWVAGRP